MAEDLEKEFEVKSQLLTELQTILDQKIESIGMLELDLGEKREEVRRIKKSLDEKTGVIDEKTRIINELQAELDRKTAIAGQLEKQLDAAQNEVLQYKAEIESIKNLLSYRMGKRFGKVFGGTLGVQRSEKPQSSIPVQDNVELPNPNPVEAAGQHSEQIPSSQDMGQEPKEEQGPVAETDLYEALKPKLSAYEKANLIAVLRQKLAAEKFAHGEPLSISPLMLELCIDSKSNMLDEWHLAWLCCCIKNFDWKDDDYLIEIETLHKNSQHRPVFICSQEDIQLTGKLCRLYNADPAAKHP